MSMTAFLRPYARNRESNIRQRCFTGNAGEPIHIPKGLVDAEALKAELVNFGREQDEETGRTSYQPRQPGVNDDLIVALGLATQEDIKETAFVPPISFLKVGGSVWRPTSDYITTRWRPSDRPWR